MYEEQLKVLDIKNIDASLSHGKIYTARRWDIIVGFLAVLGILAAVLASVGLIDVQKDKDLLSSVIIGYVIGGIAIVSAVFIGSYVSHGRRKAKLFLQDAVLLKAKAESLGTQVEARFPAIFMPATAIRVKFRYHERKIVKESRCKEGRIYLSAFKKYADREIKIAYSPHYDEVLLLKSW